MATLAAAVFGRLVEARDRAYRRGWLGVARLPAPVVSVGNLSTGGTGKTPAVMALAEALRARGWQPDVLSRGYGRRHRGLAVADVADGRVHGDVDEVGDEPWLIAQRARVPVLVHPDRFRAGCEGERRFGSTVHLLDDGFQHRQLARDFDLVLVAVSDLEARLLPAGRLREPPAALARASAVVVVGDAPGEPAGVRERVRQWTAAAVYTAWRRPKRETWPEPGEPCFAFCGIARPASFWRVLNQAGVSLVGRRAFADHHRFSAGEIGRLVEEARQDGATRLVTTAKDAARLESLRGRLQGLPLVVVEIDLEIDGLDRLVDSICAACQARAAAPVSKPNSQ